MVLKLIFVLQTKNSARFNDGKARRAIGTNLSVPLAKMRPRTLDERKVFRFLVRICM